MSKPKIRIHERLAELDKLVEWFESEEFTLEEAIERFEQASGLAETIRQELSEYKNEITVLKQKFDQ